MSWKYLARFFELMVLGTREHHELKLPCKVFYNAKVRKDCRVIDALAQRAWELLIVNYCVTSIVLLGISHETPGIGSASQAHYRLQLIRQSLLQLEFSFKST